MNQITITYAVRRLLSDMPDDETLPGTFGMFAM